MVLVGVAIGLTVPVAQSPARDPRLLLTTLALAAALLAGALIIHWVSKWRKRAVAERLTPNEQLAHFRSLYERGELSAEEFDRIRAHLGALIRKELDVSAPPAIPRSEPLRPPEPPPDGVQPPRDAT